MRPFSEGNAILLLIPKVSTDAVFCKGSSFSEFSAACFGSLTLGIIERWVTVLFHALPQSSSVLTEE